MLLPLLTVCDFSTIRANFVKPISLKAVQRRSSDFALLVPIFNSTKYLTNIHWLKKYSSKVVLCTTTEETPEFMNELRELSRIYGFRIQTCEMGTDTKNPWAIFNKTLLAHDAVLKSTIDALLERFVIFIDGDTYVDGELDVLAGAMEEHNFDIASVKVLPSKRETIMENLQGVEYDIAMQARLLYPWLTSGAGMIAKRDVMVSIMKNHSLFFNGGDVEIGRLADMMGYKVGHIPMIFYTDVPTNFMGWFKQRFSWMCGMFRHSIINLDHNLKHPFHFIYYTFIIYFLIPFKIFELITKPYMIPIIIGLYMVITYIANWKVRNKWMFLFPLYALFQVIVIIWCGIYRYVNTVRKSRNVGKIKMRHNPLSVDFLSFNNLASTAKNYAIIASIIFFICATSVGLFQKATFGQEYEALEIAHIVTKSLTAKVYAQGEELALSKSDGWGDINGQVAGAYDENLEH